MFRSLSVTCSFQFLLKYGSSLQGFFHAWGTAASGPGRWQHGPLQRLCFASHWPWSELIIIALYRLSIFSLSFFHTSVLLFYLLLSHSYYPLLPFVMCCHGGWFIASHINPFMILQERTQAMAMLAATGVSVCVCVCVCSIGVVTFYLLFLF